MVEFEMPLVTFDSRRRLPENASPRGASIIQHGEGARHGKIIGLYRGLGGFGWYQGRGERLKEREAPKNVHFLGDGCGRTEDEYPSYGGWLF